MAFPGLSPSAAKMATKSPSCELYSSIKGATVSSSSAALTRELLTSSSDFAAREVLKTLALNWRMDAEGTKPRPSSKKDISESLSSREQKCRCKQKPQSKLSDAEIIYHVTAAYLTFPGVYGPRGCFCMLSRLSHVHVHPKERLRMTPVSPRNRMIRPPFSLPITRSKIIATPPS